MKVVRDGVKSFADSLPGLLKALDEVAKLHPFISSKCRHWLVRIPLNAYYHA